MLSAGDRQRVSIAGYSGNVVHPAERLMADVEQIGKDLKLLADAIAALDDRFRYVSDFQEKQIDNLRDELTALRSPVG